MLATSAESGEINPLSTDPLGQRQPGGKVCEIVNRSSHGYTTPHRGAGRHLQIHRAPTIKLHSRIAR